MSAVLAVPGSSLSHFAAARLLRIWNRNEPDRVDVVVEARSHRRRRHGVGVHTARSLHGEVSRYRHIPVTTVPRTLLDLAGTVGAYPAANAMHAAAFRRRMNVQGVWDIIGRNRGRGAVTPLRRALDLHLAGSAGTRSWLEDEYLAAVTAAGAPEPLVNVNVPVVGGTVEVDFRWGLLCVEVDGSAHGRPADRIRDAHRDRNLRSAGYEVLRCRPEDIESHASMVAGRVMSWRGRRSERGTSEAAPDAPHPA